MSKNIRRDALPTAILNVNYRAQVTQVQSCTNCRLPTSTAIRKMSPEDASRPVVDILRTVEAADERIESLTRQVYALRGAAMLIAQEKQIYRFYIDDEWGEPFRSLDRFNKALFPKSWRYNAEALATIQKLPDVPMEKLVSTPRCNILTLTQVSSSVRSLPDVLEAAQTLSEDEFIGKLSRENGQHLDRLVTHKLTGPAPDWAQLDKYIAWVASKADLDPSDRFGVLLYLAIHENEEHDV